MNRSAHRRWRRLTALVAAVAVASVALAGCLYQAIPERPPVSTASLAPDAAGVAADLLPFYRQTLTWQDCGGGFDCTAVKAPLDWTDPGAGEIELSVIRQRATGGEPIGSLLINPGGPGASGIDILRRSIDFAVGEPLQSAYDVIGFDPRGVGASTAVKCFDAADMDAYLFDIPKNRRGTDAWTRELLDRHRAFAEACEDGSNGILPFVTTEYSARDMDLLRAVLGDSSLSYLGYSYGTFLGATYAKLYPERVGRLVLDGATDPSLSGIEQSVVQAIGFENALRAYMADCLGQSECPFQGTVDDGMSDIATLLASVDRRPQTASDGRKLGADSLFTAIANALYSQRSWPYLTAALSHVLQGNPDVAFQLVDEYYDRVQGVYTSNSAEAFRAYNCIDFPLDTDPDALAAAKAKLDAQAPTIAPYWWGPDPCEVWPYPPTGTREPITAEGAAPIVVVGTTNDPATPYEWAVSLADQLASGVLVTRVGEGHTGYNKGNACVNKAVEDYLLEGTVPEDGLRCE